MAEEAKRSKVEFLKEESRQLRGTLAQELTVLDKEFSGESETLMKFHGCYQQDNRDERKAKHADGTPKGKQYSVMVRTRVPGGKVTAAQFLTHLDLCDSHANGTLKITTRQGFQFHGVLKGDLKATIAGINQSLLTTLAACGDVNRNVITCPAPLKHNAVREQMQALAYHLAERLKPRSTAYHEIWLTDDSGLSENVAETFQPIDEPLYGTTYLPRKFKIAIALPDDNCVDIFANDLGFLAIVEHDQIVGYNVMVGGGMGRTPSAEKTFAAVAQPLAYISPEEVGPVAEAIIKVQRDFGNREDRKIARMKYLIANWGIEAFKAKVEEYYGGPLTAPRPIPILKAEDHMGWHEQGDGNLFVGINISGGRIKDDGDLRIKSFFRAVLGKYGMETRLTCMQAVILCDIPPSEKPVIEQMLRDHGITPAEELLPVRRFAISCTAFPTCGLAVAESERVLPDVITRLETELTRLGLERELFAVHITGCPNGCGRPYTPDVGIVGKTLGKYTLFVGGNSIGSRLAFIHKDLVPYEELIPTLVPLLEFFKTDRLPDESFGNFCARQGAETLKQVAEAAVAVAG